MALVENIYFSVSINSKNDEYKSYFQGVLEEKFTHVKLKACKDDVFLGSEIEVMSVGIQRYPYGFRVKDKFRVYFASNWGSNYPIYVIVDAVFLHMNSVEFVLDDIREYIIKIFKYFDNNFELKEYTRKLSRVDICNHNTFICPTKYIKLNEYNSRVVTKIRTVKPHINLRGEADQEVSYFRYQSDDWLVRVYNKTMEVCEQQYKAWFLPKWLDYGLINEATFKIYEKVFKLNRNYRIDFMYSNLLCNQSKILNEDIEDISRIYNDVNTDNDTKYDVFKGYLKKYNIKCVKEVTNVEFQLSSGFLRSLKIINTVTGEYIDFNNIDELIKNLDKLYHHITQNSFRVVVRKSNYKRKRNKETDPLWEKIQKSNILNINVCDDKKEIFRVYNTEVNKSITVRDTVAKLVRLKYLTAESIKEGDEDEISLTDLLTTFEAECNMNENYYHFKEKLLRQIKMYGEK